MLSRFSLPMVATSLVLVCGLAAHAQKSAGPVSAPVTAQGVVAGDPTADQFNLRTASGILLVKPHSAAMLKTVRGGDLVRVYGRPLGRFITGANVRVLTKKFSSNPSDYGEPRLETLDGNPDTRATATPAPKLPPAPKPTATPKPAMAPAKMK